MRKSKYFHESESVSHSVTSDLANDKPTRLLYPWNSPGRIREWVPIPFSRDLPSHMAGRFFTISVTREAPNNSILRVKNLDAEDVIIIVNISTALFTYQALFYTLSHILTSLLFMTTP